MLYFCTEPRYILHASRPYYGWLLYQIWTISTHYFLRYCNKHIKFKKNISIITQIWHRAKYCFTCISNTWYLITVLNMNKRPMSLDALLTKLLHQHNFHNIGRDPPQDASHKIWSQSSQELQEIAFENWTEKQSKKCKKWSISKISITLVETLPRIPYMKFEVNWSTKFRR